MASIFPKEIEKVFKELEFLRLFDYNSVIRHFEFDSRQVSVPISTLFFAISTPSGNGKIYIESLYRMGVRNFVLDSQFDIQLFPEANFFFVKNSIRALQELAIYVRESNQIPVIGITGSNGKTIVKEWLKVLLSKHWKQRELLTSPLSYNSQIGVPISVLGLDNSILIAIFEAGISTNNEMDILEKIIQPSIGIFTNIGTSHASGFKDINEKIREKLKLFRFSKQLIYSGDDQLLDDEIKLFKKEQNPNLELISWGFEPKNSIKINAEKDKIIIFEKEYKIPFQDSASLQNIIHCIITALKVGLNPNQIKEGLLEIHPIALRLEIKKGKNNNTIINDAYSMDIKSLQKAIELIGQQKQHSKNIFILSEFAEIEDEISLRHAIENILKKKDTNQFLILNPSQTSYYDFLDPIYFNDKSEIIDYLKSNQIDNSNILIKGGRKFSLESITEFLALKLHRTRLEINLSAVIKNYKIFRALVPEKMKLLVVIKALSYGAGSYEIASALQNQNVDYYGVAYTDEGITLREKGINTPILVLNPEPQSIIDAIIYKLTLSIYSFKLLEELIKNKKVTPAEQKVKIHLKLNTGMNRLGFDAKDLSQLCEILLFHKNWIEIEGIFSHQIASEDKDSEHTKKQISLFSNMASTLKNGLQIEPIIHFQNTGGIIHQLPYEYQTNTMGRLGIGLYGINPTHQFIPELEEISSLKSYISQIHEIEPGQGVGYHWKSIVKRRSRIATIEIGYADGLRRSLGNGNFSFLISGNYCPTIGNICMDMAMVDITDYPEINEGEEVLIFGKDYSIQHIADASQTIPYEVLTSISERVQRVYLKE